ncbi:hypothetical protein U9M48_020621 [Paspalum notatum var. saurae]|uniref:Uncharacterized protein n=1 Tax=Paspalum notatum var. saurae TaxID=547442 RepID=A0AAQ3TFV2_PASNO
MAPSRPRLERVVALSAAGSRIRTGPGLSATAAAPVASTPANSPSTCRPSAKRGRLPRLDFAAQAAARDTQPEKPASQIPKRADVQQLNQARGTGVAVGSARGPEAWEAPDLNRSR